LGHCGNEGERHLTAFLQRVYVFCLKEDTNSWLQCGKHTNHTNAVIDVSCETGYTFGDDQINLVFFAVSDHLVKGSSLFQRSTGNAFVGIYFYQMPVGVPVDQVRIVIPLQFKGRGLPRIVCRNTGVDGNSHMDVIFKYVLFFDGRYCFQFIGRYAPILVSDLLLLGSFGHIKDFLFYGFFKLYCNERSKNRDGQYRLWYYPSKKIKK